MGRGGEAEMQIGVRAQTPEEFRGWFLETMKRRERRVLNSLVQSRVGSPSPVPFPFAVLPVFVA
jgi:hypothetical protein